MHVTGGRPAWPGNPWRVAGWSMAALFLLLPLVAMGFTREVEWTALDFVVAAIVVGGVGAALELTVRMTPNPPYRLGVALALAAAVLLVWIDAAVGIIGDEDNPLNLLYLGVLGIALGGAMLARFRARGMSKAMAVAALLLIPVGITGALAGGGAPPGPAGILIFTAVVAAIFSGSAALFRRAATS